ncbi:MAG: hypothetical protein PHV17_04555 [Candidatus Omnitrophica bacterium]|nr:hypothetical protein [Candidatus Omnitrophota bacterium]
MKERELIIWKENNEIKAEMRFFYQDNELLYKFRDSLSDKIKNEKNLVIIKDKEFPTKLDSNYILVDKNDFIDADPKIKDLRGKIPKAKPLLSFKNLFSPKRFKQCREDYRKRNDLDNKVWEIINSIYQVIVQTEHDYPHITCTSKIHDSEGLINEIESIAKKLNIEFKKRKYNKLF